VQSTPEHDLAEREIAPAKITTIGDLVAHFRQNELIDCGDDGKAHSTRQRCASVLNKWVLGCWKDTSLDDVRTVAVESWLRELPLSRGTKAKIRKTMGLLFNHAIRWEFASRNPISGPVRGSGVRQSDKRERIPEILDAREFRRLEAALPLRERLMVWLAVSTGLRRGELAGLRWDDVDFDRQTVLIRRSVVDQVVGRVKTEASHRPLPIDKRIVMLLQRWHSVSKFARPHNYIFATDSNRAGNKRGLQPVSLAKVMQYRIHPVATAVGVTIRIGWHTFRHTFANLLHRNGADVKVVQELLRHSSSRITMDIYAQAVTSEKRKAQNRIVSELHSKTRIA
jgi:integrase